MLRLLCLLLALLLPVPALADGWSACVAQPAPKFFYLADKSRKLLFQMEERNGQPAAVREFDCIHGRVEGDKQKQGDLKTPEGVYFINKIITQKLDFMEYGPHAVSLNYPNPADRLRGKTGGGIWLHSKGQPIDGLTTRGCLAIERREIMEIKPLLTPGTPIIVAEKTAGAPFYGRDGKALPICAAKPCAKITEASAPAVELPKGKTEVLGKLSTERADSKSTKDASLAACVHAVEFPIEPAPAFCAVQTADAKLIRESTLRWQERREQRLESIFELYDAKAWPKASREPFAEKKKRVLAGFRHQKELFLSRDQLCVYYGPDYWVSSFPESYEIDGVKRNNLRALYWMKDTSGVYRIIGEVRIPR